MPTPISPEAMGRASYRRHSAHFAGGRWFWSKSVRDGRGGHYRIMVWELFAAGVHYGHDVAAGVGSKWTGFQASTIEELEARAAAFMAGGG